MSGRFAPIIERYRADVNADTVAHADIPVHGDVGSMYSLLRGELHWSPDFMPIMFAYNLSILLKIRVNRQKQLPAISHVWANISFSAPAWYHVSVLWKKVAICQNASFAA